MIPIIRIEIENLRQTSMHMLREYSRQLEKDLDAEIQRFFCENHYKDMIKQTIANAFSEYFNKEKCKEMVKEKILKLINEPGRVSEQPLEELQNHES
ncbi:MAG: hypothetical protein WC373_05270 [Smithella sp.]|jgi:NurA-like 5'-3' nuclease